MFRLPITAKRLQALYQAGENIIGYLTARLKNNEDKTQVIEIAYDMQSGCYVDAMINSPDYALFKNQYCKVLYQKISQLEPIDSILDAGIGEGITLVPLLDHFKVKPQSYGVDISWSRTAFAKNWLSEHGHTDTDLCTGNITDLPYADNSIDLVFTSHAIEPNQGSERVIIQELFRVARKYVILLEPSYELGDDASKQRMTKLGYCKKIEQTCIDLGLKVIEHRLFEQSANALNPTAITIIEKLTSSSMPDHVLACPEHKTPLTEGLGALYSQEGLRAYPVIGGIPCLRVENSVFASHFDKFNI